MNFNIDPAFNTCVDGPVIDDLHRLKQRKKKRYIVDTILL